MLFPLTQEPMEITTVCTNETWNRSVVGSRHVFNHEAKQKNYFFKKNAS